MYYFGTSGFWPHMLLIHVPKLKINYFQKQIDFLQARTWAAMGVYFSTGLYKLHPTELPTLHLTELRCTLLSDAATLWATLHQKLSYASFNWATPHPIRAMLHPKSYAAPSELSSTLLSYAPPFWTTLHPSCAMLHPKVYAAPSYLSCNLLSYAVPFWATLHPTKLCCIQLSYIAPYLSYAAP
jgi:hypothetical protein